MTLGLPDIPKTSDQEMYNYFIQLHKNLRALEAECNALRAELAKKAA